MIKIIFIQPGYAHYRRELFNILNSKYDILFVFLKEIGTYPSMQKPGKEWNTICLRREHNWLWMYHLAKVIVKINPDVIITSNNGSYQAIISGFIGWLLSKHVILWSIAWENPHIEKQRRLFKKVIKNIRVSLTSTLAKAIVVGGSKSKEYNQKLVNRKKPIFYAYQSNRDISMDGNRLEFKKEIQKDSEKIKLLYFSRIVDLKGLDYLIKAFAKLGREYKNIKLNIAGDGPFREYCEDLSKKLKIENIEFFGAVQNEEAWNYYNEADIFILPHNGKKIEGWGLVINEAASMSLPIITTEVAGAAGDLVVNGVNGYVVPPADVNALKEAIEKLIINENRRVIMGRESRKLFEKINNYHSMADGFDQAIQYVLPK